MTERRDMLELTCELSDEEVLARARAGATAQEELLRLARAKADWNTAHKKQVEEQEGTVSRMTNCVRTGRERRLVECVVQFHQPTASFKRIVRLDTGEEVKVEEMSRAELQENLFEQTPAGAEAESEGGEVKAGPVPAPRKGRARRQYQDDVG